MKTFLFILTLGLACLPLYAEDSADEVPSVHLFSEVNLSEWIGGTGTLSFRVSGLYRLNGKRFNEYIDLNFEITDPQKLPVRDYKRKLGHSEEILEFGESVTIPSFQAKEEKLTRVLEDLSDASSINSKNGKGLSIIALLNPNETNPVISIDAKENNFFELLDLICIQAGPDYFWSASEGVVVSRELGEGLEPVAPFDPFDTKKRW